MLVWFLQVCAGCSCVGSARVCNPAPEYETWACCGVDSDMLGILCHERRQRWRCLFSLQEPGSGLSAASPTQAWSADGCRPGSSGRCHAWCLSAVAHGGLHSDTCLERQSGVRCQGVQLFRPFKRNRGLATSLFGLPSISPGRICCSGRCCPQ
jgi:hypothetical protein